VLIQGEFRMLLSIIATGSCLYFATKAYKGLRGKKRNENDNKSVEQRLPLKINSQPVASKNKLISQDESEAAINRKLMLSVGLMGTTIGALAWPFLTWLSLPGIIYLQLPFLKRGYDELFKKRKIGAATLDCLISIVMTSLGYFFASAFFFTLYHTSRKLLKRPKTPQKRI